MNCQSGKSDKLPPMKAERSFTKALATKDRLYVIGGVSKKNSDYMLCQTSEFFDFASNSLSI